MLTLEGKVGFLRGALHHLPEVQIEKAAHMVFVERAQIFVDDRLDEAVHIHACLADALELAREGKDVAQGRKVAENRAVVIALPLEHHRIRAGTGKVKTNKHTQLVIRGSKRSKRTAPHCTN